MSDDKKPLPELIVARNGVPFADQAEGIRQFKEACLKSAQPDDWRDDPAADERWQAGCDFAMVQLCHAMGVDPKSVRWDAATETLDGDVNAVIWNIMRAKMGEDWSPDDKETIINSAYLSAAKVFEVYASDQIGSKRFQGTAKAKRECDIRAGIWNDAASELRKAAAK